MLLKLRLPVTTEVGSTVSFYCENEIKSHLKQFHWPKIHLTSTLLEPYFYKKQQFTFTALRFLSLIDRYILFILTLSSFSNALISFCGVKLSEKIVHSFILVNGVKLVLAHPSFGQTNHYWGKQLLLWYLSVISILSIVFDSRFDH